MSIFTNAGRTVIAESISLRPVHFAWGAGDGAWTTTFPAEDPNATSLIGELGRRTADVIAFVLPDAAGSIVLPAGNFSFSATPTRYLYCRTKFAFADAPTSSIREIGVFVGSVMVEELPGGQRYFLPAEVASPGRLLHLEHFQPIYRSSVIEESFEVVVTF